MSTPSDELIGPAAFVLKAARERLQTHSARGIAILLEGDPGTGKGCITDALALEITGSECAVERVNGQSLGVDTVRGWRVGSAYGNLFSAWTVKRIDEIDQASSSGMAELLTMLDYLPHKMAVLATTNEYGKLRSLCKGRLESRFVRFRVEAPSIDETAALLVSRYRLTKAVARQIALGAVPDGCLPSAGCNVRAAINDTFGFLSAKAVQDRKEVAL